MFPNANAREADCHLRPLLKRWASRYTSDDACRDELVEMTVSAAVDDPVIVFDEPIEQALCHLLHRIAVRKLHLREETPVLSEAEAEEEMP